MTETAARLSRTVNTSCAARAGDHSAAVTSASAQEWTGHHGRRAARPWRGGAWRLAWEDGWHRVGDHIERQPHSRLRLAEGRKPIRHDWKDEDRLEFTRFLQSLPPAVCGDCGTLNRIDRKRLAVSGVAAYSAHARIALQIRGGAPATERP